MKNNQNKLFACQLLILLGTIPFYINAQTKELSKKEKKKLFEALRRRYLVDEAFANSTRPAYNRSSWVGGILEELIKVWGPPSRMVSDGGEGKIAVYDNSTTHSGGSYTPGYTEYNGLGQVVGGANAVDTRYNKTSVDQANIYVDKDRIVQHIEIKFDSYYN